MGKSLLDISSGYDTTNETSVKKLSDAYNSLADYWGANNNSVHIKDYDYIYGKYASFYSKDKFRENNPDLYKSILSYQGVNNQQKKSLNQGLGGAASVLGGSVN